MENRRSTQARAQGAIMRRSCVMTDKIDSGNSIRKLRAAVNSPYVNTCEQCGHSLIFVCETLSCRLVICEGWIERNIQMYMNMC